MINGLLQNKNAISGQMHEFKAGEILFVILSIDPEKL
jgi:hypothetical protein